MTAFITKLLFDKDQLKVPPFADYFDVQEEDGDEKIGYTFFCLKDKFDQHSISLPRQECPRVTGVRSGLYTLHIGVKDKGEDSDVFINLINQDESLMVSDAVYMSSFRLSEYYADFAEAMRRAVMNGKFKSEEEAAAYEDVWSKQYLRKNLLGGRIQGPDAFWEELNDKLDTVLRPHLIGVTRAAEGQPYLPVSIAYGGEALEPDAAA
jgi:hypothetical protein